MATEDLVCARDSTPTRLACAQCGAGICPRCMVRTPVGHKCPQCVGLVAAPGRRTWPVVVAAAVAVAVLGLVGMKVLRPTPRHVQDVVAAQATPDAAPTSEAMIGEEVHDGQLSFTVDAFACGAKQLQAGGTTHTAQGKFCLLNLTVRNPSNSPTLFLSRFQYLIDGQRTFGPDDGLTAAMEENGNRSLTDLNVNPDLTVPMVLVYDVPGASAPAEAQLKGNGRARFGINVRLQNRAAS